MNTAVDSIPVRKGEMLYFKTITPAGNAKYKSGEVVDVNDHVNAVKLRWVVSIQSARQKSEWFPAKDLVRSIPVKEEVKQ